MNVEQVESSLSKEAWDVLLWRQAVLERAGYAALVAMKLAETEVDLHKACELLERGCTQTQALRILL